MADFEAHITVFKDLNILLNPIATELNLKLLDIILVGGTTDNRFQPMFTFRLLNTSFSNVDVIANYYKDRLQERGLKVTRIKIEADPSYEGKFLYYERHIKVKHLDSLSTFNIGRSILDRHGGKLSLNSIKGTKFITQRSRPDSEITDDLLDILAQKGIPVLKVEDEKVVYDSNLDLDKGW